VTTGEIWQAWIEHPELASAVDFIAAHVLPYWEGHLGNRRGRSGDPHLRSACGRPIPGKRIVIAEFGWPSAGYNRRDANPDPLVQARVLRSFVARAESLGIDYNIIEAYDQPWKTFEGGVGPYWGMFDTTRQPKFSWTGPITDPDHWKLAGIAVLIGVLLSLPILSLAGGDRRPDAMLAATGPHRRRVVCDPVRLLERALFRDRARPSPTGSRSCSDPADLHRDEAHRGDRQRRVRNEAEPVDPVAAARPRIAVYADGFDSHSGL
jgi:hypothetical protein